MFIVISFHIQLYVFFWFFFECIVNIKYRFWWVRPIETGCLHVWQLATG